MTVPKLKVRRDTAANSGMELELSPNTDMAMKNTKKPTTTPKRVARAHMRKNPQPMVLRLVFILPPVGWSGRESLIGGGAKSYFTDSPLLLPCFLLSSF